MTRLGILTAILITLLLFVAGAWPSPATDSDAAKQAAQQSADTWLALMDSGNYSASWDTAAQIFKAAASREQWERMAQAARAPLGKLVVRKLKSANYTTTLPGVPDGKYVVMRYETSFENKKTAVETITPMLDKDGKWRVSGYYIR